MSERLPFQVFYGSGDVRYGPEGVDLSDFSSFRKEVPRARERTWVSICNWLFKAFGLNREQHEISVMAVVNRREPIFWELLPLQGTQNWRNYVNLTTSRGLPLVLFVQAFEKATISTEAADEDGGQGGTVLEDSETMHGQADEDPDTMNEAAEDGDASQEPREATGEADEGEDNPRIVNEFQREGEEHVVDDSSSDDEDNYSVPQNWDGYDFTRLSVNDGQAVQ